MTNEEKINELLELSKGQWLKLHEVNIYDRPDNTKGCLDAVYYPKLLEIAQWKEQQMIDRAKEFISTWFYEHPHTSWLICSDEFQDLDDCLERLEKEMTEENNDDN